MKLPDFSIDGKWNALRREMNAPLVEFDWIQWVQVNPDDFLEKLNSTGIEVDFTEITVEGDGTFNFQGHKVLIYIKDQRFNPRYDNENKEYKFHICNCQTIEDFRSKNQLDRYVVSRRTDGTFLVNEMNTSTREYLSKDKYKPMNVCKNCLMHLSYNGYADHKTGKRIYEEFTLDSFFSQYKGSQFHTTPNFYAEEALDDTYTPDFPELSTKYRASKNWKCESCSLDLAADRGYLHVHHKNGIKSDNGFSNLKAVCLGCHAEEPGHQRMKFSQSYINFMMKYKNPWESLRRNIA
jgi:hypothetical protein